MIIEARTKDGFYVTRCHNLYFYSEGDGHNVKEAAARWGLKLPSEATGFAVLEDNDSENKIQFLFSEKEYLYIKETNSTFYGAENND